MAKQSKDYDYMLNVLSLNVASLPHRNYCFAIFFAVMNQKLSKKSLEGYALMSCIINSQVFMRTFLEWTHM